MYWCLATFISDFAGINEKLFRWKLSVAWYVDALVCVCVFLIERIHRAHVCG